MAKAKKKPAKAAKTAKTAKKAKTAKTKAAKTAKAAKAKPAKKATKGGAAATKTNAAKTTKTPKTTAGANETAANTTTKASSSTKPKATTKAKPAKPPEPTGVLPTAEEEARFWSLLEDAWATQPAASAARAALATRTPGGDDDEDDLPEGLEDALDNVLAALRAALADDDFPQAELVAMDRVLERKLYDIDREEIQAVTDGSDDGFLYARGFIVALGKAFYDAVNANPQMAIMDAELETMCYLPAEVHQERFGAYPETGSDISRESGSNLAGWGRGGDGDD